MKKKHNIGNKLKDKFYRDDELIESLTDEYLEKYRNLDRAHVYALVKKISGLATSTFDNGRCMSSDFTKKIFALNLKEAMSRELNEVERGYLVSSSRILYDYVQGQNNRIAQCFEYANLSYEDPSLYQELVVALARDRAEVVANTVLNWLPLAVRYAPSEAHLSSPSPDSVDSLEGDANQSGKKSFVDMVAKRPRLTFENENIKKKNLNFQEESEEAAQDKGTCSVCNNDAASNAETFVDQNIDSNQRSVTAIEETKGTGEEARENNGKTGLILHEHDNILLNPQLTRFYTWLSELPEWLQKQILNSSPAQALIQAAEQTNNIYNIKTISQVFVELNIQINEQKEGREYDQDTAHIAERTLELIDLSLTSDANLLPYAIMHDSAPVFGELLQDQAAYWF